MPQRLKGRTAWRVAWEWAWDHAAVAPDEVVPAVLPPQRSAESVRQIMEILYAARQYSAVDKLQALRPRFLRGLLEPVAQLGVDRIEYASQAWPDDAGWRRDRVPLGELGVRLGDGVRVGPGPRSAGMGTRRALASRGTLVNRPV